MADDGGIARLQRRMAAIPEEIRKDAGKSVVKQANKMAGTMEALVPVDDGDLKESIKVTGPGQRTPAYSQPGGSMVVPENAAAITVGNEDVRYGHLVEYGHKNGLHGTVVPPHPFFWPAVRLEGKKARRNIKSAVSRTVKKHWGKS